MKGDGAHIGIVTVVDVVRDGKGHLEDCRLVGIIRPFAYLTTRWSYIWSGPGGHLTGAVLVVDDDVGVGVDDA